MNEMKHEAQFYQRGKSPRVASFV